MRILLDPSGANELLKRLPHPDESRPATGGIDDRIGKSPAQLLDDLQTHGLLSLDAVRLPQRRGVEPASLRRELARRLPCVTNVTADGNELRAKDADGIENGARSLDRCVDAHRNPRCGAVGGKRGTRIACCRNDHARNAERFGARDGRAYPTPLERPGGIEPLLLDPHSTHAKLPRRRLASEERCRAFAEGHRRLVRHERHPRRVSPHVPPVEKGLRAVREVSVPHEVGLHALGAHLRQRVTRRGGRTRGALERPVCHAAGSEVLGTPSAGVGAAPGSSGASAKGEAICSASRIFCAAFGEKPGSAAICSTLASRTPCTLPNARSSALRFDGPTPGIRRSSDVTVRIVRRLRLYVTANRCASSRACCRSRSAGERRARRSGSLFPMRKTSSSRLARLIVGRACSSSASSAARAAASCPLPPSITTRSGSDLCSSSRR